MTQLPDLSTHGNPSHYQPGAGQVYAHEDDAFYSECPRCWAEAAHAAQARYARQEEDLVATFRAILEEHEVKGRHVLARKLARAALDDARGKHG